MHILAFETSSIPGSIAALAGNDLIRQIDLRADQRTAQSLTPAIAELLLAADWKAEEVELVAVASGPGSFTGLRVGVTAAKTFAYAVGCEVIGVNTLEALAVEAMHGETSLSGERSLYAVLDAQRRQLFSARFHTGGETIETDQAARIVDQEAWLADLEPGAFVTGGGLAKLGQPLPENVHKVDEKHWKLQAKTVGRLGYRRYCEGTRDDLWKLAPFYLRKSAAEEKWEQKISTAGKGEAT